MALDTPMLPVLDFDGRARYDDESLRAHIPCMLIIRQSAEYTSRPAMAPLQLAPAHLHVCHSVPMLRPFDPLQPHQDKFCTIQIFLVYSGLIPLWQRRSCSHSPALLNIIATAIAIEFVPY